MLNYIKILIEASYSWIYFPIFQYSQKLKNLYQRLYKKLLIEDLIIAVKWYKDI